MINLNNPVRKRNRLKGYNYANDGAYFVTICTQNKECLLSHIEKGSADVTLTAFGCVVKEHIERIPGIDKYVIMPNHIHMIIIKSRSASDLAQDIKAFKSIVTKKIKKPIWQRSYYDHIIRDDEDYQIKTQYIIDNPAKWAEDKLFTP